jgi:hypothetical protein
LLLRIVRKNLGKERVRQHLLAVGARFARRVSFFRLLLLFLHLARRHHCRRRSRFRAQDVQDTKAPNLDFFFPHAVTDFQQYFAIGLTHSFFHNLLFSKYSVFFFLAPKNPENPENPVKPSFRTGLDFWIGLDDWIGLQ